MGAKPDLLDPLAHLGHGRFRCWRWVARWFLNARRILNTVYCCQYTLPLPVSIGVNGGGFFRTIRQEEYGHASIGVHDDLLDFGLGNLASLELVLRQPVPVLGFGTFGNAVPGLC